jgi:CHAT domain-containing protein/tetratricopeptide (TPR) repeat protein
MSTTTPNVPYGAILSRSIRPILDAMPGTESPVSPTKQIDDADQKLLAVAAMFMPPPESAAFHARLTRGDAAAGNAMEKMRVLLAEHLPAVMAACSQERSEGRWQLLRQDSILLTALAVAFGMPELLLRGLYFGGIAAGKLDRHAEAVRCLSQALELKVDGQQATYASIHETLAEDFEALQQYDESMVQYQQALGMSQDANAAQRITRKEANLLAKQGEYRRAAGMMESQVQALKDAGMAGNELAMNLDMCAQYLLGMGNSKRAIEMLVDARALFEAGGASPNDFLVNVWALHEARKDSGDKEGAAQAFEQAHDLAFRIAQEEVDPQHYRAGFAAALKTLLPPSEEPYKLLEAGVAALKGGDTRLMFELWTKASQHASQMGDQYLSLWIEANTAATSMDQGFIGRAIEVAKSVRTRALELGYVKPELMVTATLGSLASSGANIESTIPTIGLIARAAVLLKVQAQFLSTIRLEPSQIALYGNDTGNVDSILAKTAEEAGHDVFTAQYYQSAVNKARSAGMVFELINRLCGLNRVQRLQSNEEAAAKTAVEIEQLLNSAGLEPRARIVGERTLGLYFAPTDFQAALRHMRAASDAMEDYRSSLPVGDRRGFDREFREVPARLAELLRKQGDSEGAFDALQLGKGRSLIDSLSSLQPGAKDRLYEPLTLKETQRLLAGPGAGSTVLLDFAVTLAGIVTYCVSANEFRVLVTNGSYSEFDEVQFGDVEDREGQIVSATLNSPLLRELARTIVEALPEGSKLMVVPDAFLHNLPLHAVPVTDRPWGDLMSFSYSPTAAILRFAPRNASSATALLAGDSVGNLPGAREECRAIGAILHSQPLLGADCTLPAFSQALKQGPQMVHLAVHGRADVLNGGRSGLLFADAEAGSQWVDIDDLAQEKWKARLVVFSGCSTGVVGFRHGTEMLSAPNTVLEAGASTVIASLWPVDDDFAKRLMTCFYSRLYAGLMQGPVDLRRLLDEARFEVRQPAGEAPHAQRRDGRHIRPLGANDQKPELLDQATKEALSWAAFCVFGIPIYG